MLFRSLLTTLVPVVVAAAGVLVAAMAGRRWGIDAAWAVGVAVALAYGVGHIALLGPPPWPPAEASQWLPLLALAAAAVATIEGHALGAEHWWWRVRLLLLVAATTVALHPLLAYSWGPVAAVGRIGVTVVVAGLVWTALAGVARRMPALPLAVLLIACTTALSVATLLAHSASLAQLAGILAAALGGSAAAVLLLRGALPLAPVVAVAAPMLVFLATIAHFYADLPLAAVALLGAAPAAAWLGVARGGGAWPALTAAVALAAGAVATAAFGG